MPLESNRSIQIEAGRERVSSDAGALLLRELMDRLGYARLFERHLRDPRDPVAGQPLYGTIIISPVSAATRKRYVPSAPPSSCSGAG